MLYWSYLPIVRLRDPLSQRRVGVEHPYHPLFRIHISKVLICQPSKGGSKCFPLYTGTMNNSIFWNSKDIHRTVLFQTKVQLPTTEVFKYDPAKPPIPTTCLEIQPDLQFEMHKMQHLLLYVLGGTNS